MTHGHEIAVESNDLSYFNRRICFANPLATPIMHLCMRLTPACRPSCCMLLGSSPWGSLPPAWHEAAL